jgi:hypothetical protein
MKLTILIAMAVLVSACATDRTDEIISAHSGAQRTGICEVHHTRMHKKPVAVTFGLPVEGYAPKFETEMLRFPHARDHANWGCMVDKNAPKFTPVYACSDCERSKWQWIRAHPSNQWARDQKHAAESQKGQ